MFNSDTWQSHAEYQDNFHRIKAKYIHSDARVEMWTDYAVERAKLMALNLDHVGEYVSQLYPDQGRPAKNQAQILRSLVLFALLFNRTDARLSLTLWVREVLPNKLLFIALIGCTCKEDLPPLGSYYDFMNRLWGESRECYSRSFILPAGKNGKKPKKILGSDGKLVEPEADIFSTKIFVEKIISGEKLSNGSAAALHDIFYLAAVLPSRNCGLINRNNLTISGDGTAVAVHASPFGNIPAACRNSGCVFTKDCTARHYSDPDAKWGWDSHEKKWYFGHTLYMLCCHNKNYHVDLPLLINYTGAERHDSINFLYAWDAFCRHSYEIMPINICLDSAHDNIPTYRLLDYMDINALIDINGRSKTIEGLPEDITLDKNGHPHCKAGYKMYGWGYDKNKDAYKYRCPVKCKSSGICKCSCQSECSKSNYGRTVYIKGKNDLRFHPRIPRGSSQYAEIYSERTASERVNNRVLNDYHLLDLKIRGVDHYLFWSVVIGICIHLDARYKTGMLK